MGHTKATADKAYYVRKREDNALHAAAEMGTLMGREKKGQEIVSDSQDSFDVAAKRKRWSKEENEAV